MRGRLSLSASAVIMAVVLAVIGALPAAAGDGRSRDDGRSGSGHHQRPSQYLALGDSIPFGYNPLLIPPASASVFVGYPELAATKLNFALTNASCPGQTSGGFISLAGTDNGCFKYLGAGFPLHTTYTGSQLDFAVSKLDSNPNTRLVTLTLGGNDLLFCKYHTADGCASPDEIGPVLTAYEQNLAQILTAIRTVYHGKLVAVTYYSPDYNDPLITGALTLLNAITTQLTVRFHGTTADGFAAFAAKAADYGGDTCATGLLIRPDPNGPCDFHPTRAGAQLLADTLTAAVSCDPGYGDNRNRDDSLVGASDGS
jgi:lysophospholipase L1-like esterase